VGGRARSITKKESSHLVNLELFMSDVSVLQQQSQPRRKRRETLNEKKDAEGAQAPYNLFG
jgi:hypothetical protein